MSQGNSIILDLNNFWKHEYCFCEEFALYISLIDYNICTVKQQLLFQSRCSIHAITKAFNRLNSFPEFVLSIWYKIHIQRRSIQNPSQQTNRFKSNHSPSQSCIRRHNQFCIYSWSVSKIEGSFTFIPFSSKYDVLPSIQ